jgi:hypothetical protein
VDATGRAGGIFRVAAIEGYALKRIVALATRHDRVLRVKFMAPSGAEM